MSHPFDRRVRSMASALVAAGAMLALSASTRADDAKPKDSNETISVEKVGDATSDNAPENETAAQAIQRIEQKYGLRVANANAEEFEKAKAAFLEKYPNDPLRWRLKMLEAQRSLMNTGGRTETIKKAQAGLMQIAAAKDAPQDVREQASHLNIQIELVRGASKDEMLKTVSEHFKQFPNSPINSSIAQMFLRSVTAGLNEEKAMTVVQEYKDSSVSALASAAAQKITELETLIELKKNPVDLKFTAVDGREVNLETFRGKVVLIDFWATWCGPCVAGMPEVIEQYSKFHDQGFEIVGISFDSDRQSLETFVKDHGMAWAQYFDGKGWQNQYGQKYGIHAIPTMWLVGKDGRIVDFGARAELPDKIARLVNEAPSDQPAAK